ncbi:LysM peptidoglycan-binding domain-containing protein [Enterococcus sp. MMGLQ5-2]|nr:LysM peptidoglycan-binding domain-containing protein [Enterococcus sp. MMGLQ5-2]MBS7576560.1 LysM peptidoglycan-binding domain-containing protein [Enterococcus sp. MMGLQ5-2]MBS7583953.1 LysM peptidoglycan-binding domain-containing protein [Enterococcus sp. MMGLQ5-1]NPD11814.1 LysM peptidoglycan-binding domain-containing protein [Enterococcus sp. MMGLQ5-1]NPD36397.1 LysM peptidoglycan-binding domain-containing protein [Enterococcus sp. MMGLQ5-2]
MAKKNQFIRRRILRQQREQRLRKQRARRAKLCGIASLSAITVLASTMSASKIIRAEENEQILAQNEAVDIATIKTGNDFIDSIAPLATSFAIENDLYASVMLAQAFIESGGGKSELSQAPYYNLFGIKGSFEGHSINMLTQEQAADGSYTLINADFRSYPSFVESMADYTDILSTEFYQGARKSFALNYAEATAFLTGRYATSLTYAQTLNSIIELFDLTRFDNASGLSAGISSISEGIGTINHVPVQYSSKIYAVQANDTLDSIAQMFQVSVSELMDWNNLPDDMTIYPDQRLVVDVIQRLLVTEAEKIAAAEQKYTIAAGDTLYEIALTHQLELADLMSWNQLTDSLIYAGNQLIIRPADLGLQNEQKIRENQLALETEYVGEIFNLPSLEGFDYQISGDLNQYQIDYYSQGQWQSSLQKRTYSDSEIAAIANQLKATDGKPKTLADGSTVFLSKGKKLSNLSFFETEISVNIINHSKTDSVAIFESELKTKAIELKAIINQTLRSDVLIKINLTKDDASRYAVSWREGNVVYTASAKSISLLHESLPS